MSSSFRLLGARPASQVPAPKPKKHRDITEIRITRVGMRRAIKRFRACVVSALRPKPPAPEPQMRISRPYGMQRSQTFIRLQQALVCSERIWLLPMDPVYDDDEDADAGIVWVDPQLRPWVDRESSATVMPAPLDNDNDDDDSSDDSTLVEAEGEEERARARAASEALPAAAVVERAVVKTREFEGWQDYSRASSLQRKRWLDRWASKYGCA